MIRAKYCTKKLLIWLELPSASSMVINSLTRNNYDMIIREES